MDLVPERIGKWLVGPGRGILVLESDEEVLRLKLLDDTRKELASTQIRASDYSSASIDDFLQSHGFTRDGVDIGIRLSSEKIFARKLTLPGEARGSIDEIVAEDLTRKTPFRLNDVYHGIAVRQVEGADKLSVWQWVTRRKFVEDDVAPFAIDPESVAFADSVVRDEVNSPFPFIPLRPHASTRMSLLQKSALALLQRCVSRIACGRPQIFAAARGNGRPRRADRGCEAQGPAGPLRGGKNREEPEHTCPHSVAKVRDAGIARRLGGDNPGVAFPFMAHRAAPDRSAGKK